MLWSEEQQLVKETIAQFPEVFRVNRRGNDPKDNYRIDPQASFVGSDGTVWLVIEVQHTKDFPEYHIKAGDWGQLCRATPGELRALIIKD